MLEPSGHTMLVLDQDTIGDLLKFVLERRCGDRVIKGGSGGYALELCQEDPPDAIWTYYFLGDMNAWDFARQLRTTPGIEHIPLLVWSANPALGWLASLYEAGVTAHLLEPFQPVELLLARDALLAGQQYGFERLLSPPEE
ncbi:MAG: response regulator [Chloroflexi bacterium]|jgi:CheY-like chemotaxis protein|nr:response regulator [Chloroflexota bacterium]